MSSVEILNNNSQDYGFDSIEDIIADFKQGKMVVMLDDEDRENEGDLFVAAECVTPEKINFMAQYGRGLICLILTEERCDELSLPLMVSGKNKNNAPFNTNFTVSVEAAKGVTTGISAGDRATTIKACIKDGATSNDIVQPGHIFPIMAQPGGVLARAGHTEASSDLARLSGFAPYAVLVEILNEDGSMARRDDLLKFAKKHDIKIGTVADLIEYRLRNETTIAKKSEQHWPTKYGDFKLITFEDTVSKLQHYVLIKGELNNINDAPFVRVHVENKLTDLLHYKDHEHSPTASGWPLDDSIKYIAGKKSGAVVILSNPEYNLPLGKVGEDVKVDIQNKKDNINKKQQLQRRIGIGSQILKSVGISKMRVLSNPVKYYGLTGFGLEVVEYISYKENNV